MKKLEMSNMEKLQGGDCFSGVLAVAGCLAGLPMWKRDVHEGMYCLGLWR